MAMAISLQRYLDGQEIHYDIVKHTPTNTSMETAEAAHIPGDKLVKTVLLKDEKGYLMAVIPSTYHVELSDLPSMFNRRMKLVPEEEIAKIFTDCEVGAIPPLGHAYAMNMIVDNKLINHGDLYIETGDHENLAHITDGDFSKLVTHTQCGNFTRHN